MSKPRRTEPESAGEPRGGRLAAAIVAVPRAWLVLVTVLVVVPWLVAGAIYLRESEHGEARRSADPPTAEGRRGPWGRLVLTEIVISPPAEYVPRTWGPVEPIFWHVPLPSLDDVGAFLSSAGLAAGHVARLQSGARPHRQAGGWVLTPEPDLVRGLSPEVRGRLYAQLAKSELNVDQQTAYRFYGTSPDVWLAPPVSARTRALVEPLIYRQRDFMYFADIEAVRGEIENGSELQLLARSLFKQSTLLVGLRVDSAVEVPEVAEYWGRGGRRTDIRPVLESIAGGGAGRTIDVAHLLPPLAREHLYRYPKVTVADHEKPLLANCLWTALNFFSPVPDDRFLDVHAALDTLKSDYYLVHDNLQLGDVVAFADREGNLFHAAVHLADGLVFGKNGNSPLAPWSILPIDRLRGHYSEHGEDWQITFHRRKDL